MRLYFLLWSLMAVMILAGCASAPPQVITVPVLRPCPSAIFIPAAPARELQLNAADPGQAVQDYAANRAEWIGYGDQLRAKLEGCRQ